MESRILALCFVTCFAVLFSGTYGLSNEAQKYLLPGDIMPIHYDLRLNVHADSLFEDKPVNMFDGYVVLTLVPVQDNVRNIVINIRKNLDITSSLLFVNYSTPIYLGHGLFDPVTQKVSYTLKNPLVKSQPVMLNLSFTGEFVTTEEGFYRKVYMENGKKKVLLGTKFQPTFTRAAFPCFDEPKYKTSYNISVSLPKKAVEHGYGVLANTELESVEKGNDRYTYHFKKTPLPISSYLIAVLVSDFKSTPPMYFNTTYVNSDRKEFRTWSFPSIINKGDLVQIAGVELMDIYEKDYKIGYGFDKVDQVSVADFPGGMENWGLIYYWGPERMFSNRLDETVLLMAHEIGHQWFGNLVTCHWWSDTWLNEGFATYVEYFGADKIRTRQINATNWLLPYQFVIDVHHKAFQKDIPGLSHPMTVEIYEPDSIFSYFDVIEYKKAGSVIRMWTHVLGMKAFDKAIQIYLRKHKESFTIPQDLLLSFDLVANQSISLSNGQLPSKLFKCWIVQEGYPVVNVIRSPDVEPKFTLTQEVFRYRRQPGDVKSTWNIPISYSTSEYRNFNQTHASHWLKQDERMLNITFKNLPYWIVVNNQESGYYRVNYDPQNWKRLLNILTNPHTTEYIHEINKAQIIDDAANLARSTANDYVPYSFFMDLTTYLENEKGYFPWKAALNNFEYLDRMLSKDKIAHPLFKKHVLRLMHKLYESLTSFEKKTDSFQDKKLRSEVISWMCKMGDLKFLQNMGTILKEHLNNRMDVPQDIIPKVYCRAVMEGDDALWKTFWQMYLKSENLAEKKELMAALSCTRNRQFLTMILERTLDKSEIIGFTERRMIFSSVYDSNPENVNLLLNFVSENFETIYELYGGSVNFDFVLTKLSEGLGTDEEMAQMKALLTSIRNSDSSELFLPEGITSRIIETVEINNDWLKKRSSAVREWLTSHYSR